MYAVSICRASTASVSVLLSPLGVETDGSRFVELCGRSIDTVVYM